jgi:single-strand DNA-binding protein
MALKDVLAPLLPTIIANLAPKLPPGSEGNGGYGGGPGEGEGGSGGGPGGGKPPGGGAPK